MRTLLLSLLVLAGCVAGEPRELELKTYLAAIEQRMAPEKLSATFDEVGADFDQRWPILDIVRFRATPEAAARLREYPGILEIERVITAAKSASRERPPAGAASTSSQVTPWGVTRVGGPGVNGGGRLWVFDSGVDLENPDLIVDADLSKDIIAELDDDANDDLRSEDDDDEIEANLAHGTAVAGVAAAVDNDLGVIGVAPGATVVSIRVLDNRGYGRGDRILAGLDYAASRADRGDVFNLSFAIKGRRRVLETAIARVADRGIAVVMAAGNGADEVAVYSPAGLDHTGVYTVSSIDEEGCLVADSNWGPTVDFAAPGSDIITLRPGGGLAVFDGTSFAAPHVAGLLLSGKVHSNGNVTCGDSDGVAEPVAHR